ncbi:MAG: hypothetical protein HKN92_01630 [Chitinophagales bacterium]|nr:hypothetical protein [Chitinophagales bacterium]
MKFLNFLLMILVLAVITPLYSQTESEVDKPVKVEKKPVRTPFENGILLDRNTIVQPRAKSFEMVIQHRFGNVNSEGFDLIGIFGPSNIRIGFNYSIWDKFQIGIGSSKNRLVQDLNWKWAILQQSRGNEIPLFITYYGNAAVEALKKEQYEKVSHRFSYYHEVMFARKFTKDFTAQLTFNYAHFNVVDSSGFIPEGESEIVNHDYKHDNFSVGILARYKVSSQMSVVLQYDQSLIFLDVDEAQPNLMLGIEIATGSHAFQIYAGSYRAIIPQYNMVYNQNKFWKGDVAIGFNITRMWNY